MTWVRVDDQFRDHPKFLDVSLAGVGLWISGLTYCSRYLTDGFISDAAARRLGATRKRLDELKAVGLWRSVDGGWVIHDYEQYNPTADQVREDRARKAAAGRRGGRARAGVLSSNGQADRQADRQAESKQSAKQGAKLNSSTPSSPHPIPSHPIPSIYKSCVTTSPPPNNKEEDEETSRIVETAVAIVAQRRLAARSSTLEPVVDLRKWLDVTTGNLLGEHRSRIAGLALEGLDGPAIADVIEPPATSPAAPQPAPVCRWCSAFVSVHHTEDECSRKPLERAQP